MNIKTGLKKYHNLEVRDINDYFEEEDKKIFERLGIKLKKKIKYIRNLNVNVYIWII